MNLLMFRTFLLSRRDFISVEKGYAPLQKSRRDVINCVPDGTLHLGLIHFLPISYPYTG